MLSQVRNAPFSRHLDAKCINLPRQARDKHRESSKESGSRRSRHPRRR